MKDEILKKFCSDEEMRPAMMNPFINGDFVCATNGLIAIIISKSLAEKDYSQNPSLKLLEILESTTLLDTPINISFKDFNFPKEPIYETIDEERDCSYCNGTGECECMDCGAEHECGKCDGTGKVGRKIKTGKIIGEEISDQYRIKIETTFFNPKYIAMLTDISEEWQLLSLAETQASLWQSGDVKVLVMPLRYDETSKQYQVIEIKPTN